MKRRFRRSHIAEQIERPRLQMRRRGKLRVEVDGKERGNVVPARRRVDEIGGERGVEHEALGGQTVFQQRVHEVLDVVADLFDVGREQRAQQRVPVAGIAVEEKLRAQRLLFALLPLHDHAGEVGQREHRHMVRRAEACKTFFRPFRARHGLGGHGAFDRLCGAERLRRGLYPHFLDELMELQTHEQRIERVRRRFAQVVLRRELQRRIGEDRREVIALPCAFLALSQFFDDAGLGVKLRQETVNFVNAAVLLNERHRRLFADAGNARDVVARVAHECLEVNDVDRLKAVLLGKALGRHALRGGLPHAGGDELDGRVLRDELKRILVTRRCHAVPARRLASARDGADEVVRLVARQLVARDVHRVEYLLHHRKLHRQLLGHPLALGLVALVLQVAEGRLAPVEGHAHRVGPLLVLQPRHRDQKAVNGLRVKPVLRRQGTDAVIGAIEDRVAVQHHQLHRQKPPCSHSFSCYSIAHARAKLNKNR